MKLLCLFKPCDWQFLTNVVESIETVKVKGLRFADGNKQGWTLNYKQILQVYEMARNMEESLSMEEVEAVMLAMVDLGFAATKRQKPGE